MSDMIPKLKEMADSGNLIGAQRGIVLVAAQHIEELQATVERLAEFAPRVIEVECWSLFPQDGGDIQKLAQKLDLIVPHTVTEKDMGGENDFEVGEIVFKFSETLQEP